MKNLYNKIYKAVNEGIQKALLIDPEQNNVSINYSYHKMNNSIDPLQIEFVDLGLPSGTLWCSHNVGATCDNTVESWHGGYYAWGETVTKPKYDWEIYTFIDVNTNTYVTEDSIIYRYNTDNQFGEVDNLKFLQLKDDIANIEYSDIKYPKIFKSAKMPTERQANELLTHTVCKSVRNYNGVEGLNGNLCISLTNNNSIFIPAGGYQYTERRGQGCYLWTNTLNSAKPMQAYCMWLGNDANTDISGYARSLGLNIRAVYNKNDKSCDKLN